MKPRFIPVTPAETALFDLESPSAERAWKRLLAATKRAGMPYTSQADLEARGYVVCELTNGGTELVDVQREGPSEKA